MVIFLFKIIGINEHLHAVVAIDRPLILSYVRDDIAHELLFALHGDIQVDTVRRHPCLRVRRRLARTIHQREIVHDARRFPAVIVKLAIQYRTIFAICHRHLMFFVIVNTFDDLCICIPQLAAQNRCFSAFWLLRQAKQFFYLPRDDFSSPVVVFKLPAIVQIQEAGNETFAVFVIPHVREFCLIPHKRLVLNTFQQRIQNVLRIIRLLARMLFDQLPQIHNVFEVVDAFPRTDQSDAWAAFDLPFARIVVRRVAQR